MAGIYIHIPFCKQACYYCNFHFSTSLKHKNDFVGALLKEMEVRSDYINDEPVETIYFGGGTPSLLTEEELGRIMEHIPQIFQVVKGAEITLEVNPDDIVSSVISSGTGTKEEPGAAKLTAWKKAGINRLSMGIQSFFETDLQWMNRAHNADQAITSIRLAQAAGFHNISIDLIYGAPTLPDDHWRQNVEQALKLGIPHLSCYALTVEPRTALDKMIRHHKKAAVDPEDQARQFLLLMDWLAAAGYEHYEISNFALPGNRSRHNSSYWQGKPYLGLGPSAHSYDGISRQWNIANNALYTAAWLETTGKHLLSHKPADPDASRATEQPSSNVKANPGAALIEREVLTPTQQLNEYIMISLRTMEGCDLSYISNRFGTPAAREIERLAEPYLVQRKITRSGEALQLTREGKLLADGIAGALFFGSLP